MSKCERAPRQAAADGSRHRDRAGHSAGDARRVRRLFENQQRLAPNDLLGSAKALGLDVERFTLELESHMYRPRVREDFLSGVRSGVNGTPTFFVNGVRHNGGWDLESMLTAIRASEL